VRKRSEDPGQRAQTLGELRAQGYVPRTVKEEMRGNLLRRLGSEEPLFPGITGYDDTVIPALENAILAGHDVCFLGERGQAKTRIARLLIGLLDEHIPVIAGSELNDDPFAPISPAARALVADRGDETPIDWLSRERRYTEKLATPDITIADLIGEVDPIKVAEGRYLADETTIHYGLVPRANRGIFAVNELPDLAERIQVGLLNILEERDVQIRGYTLRLPLDVYMVASANPEDYTSRGRIITPLKDRLGSQIRTHYPLSLEDEMEIMTRERTPITGPEMPELVVPQFMLETIAELSHLARRSPEISQRSGVSVRVSIANLETVSASAVKRAARLRERQAVPRVSDLPAAVASTAGKIELESLTDELPEQRVVDRLLSRSVLAVFNRRLDLDELDELVDAFESGLVVDAGANVRSADYLRWVKETPGMLAVIARLAGGTSEMTPEMTASAAEFVLEGLHLNRRLNKDRTGAGGRYRR
jgi:magnesium chelatase subunit I